MPNIVIAGTGQLEIFPLIDSINSSLSESQRLNVLGFIDDNVANRRKSFKNFNVLGGFEWIVDNETFVTNTIARTCLIRQNSAQRLESLGANFLNLVHPDICLSYIDEIGKGNIVDKGSILQPGSSLSNHNMLLTGVILGHGVSIGSYCFLGHNVVCNGDVFIGDNVFIGSGSQILPGVNISDGCTIAPGSVIVSDTMSCSRYFGNPARRFAVE